MLRDVVCFTAGSAANEDLPDELGEHLAGCSLVYVVGAEDVVAEWAHGTPPPPPPSALEEGGGHV